MPIINITLIEGYDAAARKRLAQRITNATVSVIKAPVDLVTVIVNEVAADNYMRGAVNRTPGPAQPIASTLIQSFLSAMEQRDLLAASAYLAEDFSMIFPGDVRFTQLEELTAWAQARYQSVAKVYERFDVCYVDGASVVYCYGTLQGVWLNGSEFSGIRFIDRFSVVDGLIATQQVWNDMAEVSRSL